MGLFSKKPSPQAQPQNPVQAPPANQPAQPQGLQQQFLAGRAANTPPTAQAPVSGGGTINLSKGSSVNLTKTQRMTATCTWPSTTDYDVYALVEYRDGHVEHVATFGTQDRATISRPATQDGGVRHLGDVTRGGGQLATETIEVVLNDNIVKVVPVVYSAQSNGTGSFRRYRVSMAVSNGQQVVQIDAPNASDNDTIYSCVPGIIHNGAQVRIEATELYSQPGSEHRPALDRGIVVMDAGPLNEYK